MHAPSSSGSRTCPLPQVLHWPLKTRCDVPQDNDAAVAKLNLAEGGPLTHAPASAGSRICPLPQVLHWPL